MGTPAPWRRSIRTRFGIWTAGLLLLVLSGLYLFVYGSMLTGLSSGLDSSLRVNALQAAAAIQRSDDGLLLVDQSDGWQARDFVSEGYTVRLLTPSGRVLQAIGPYSALRISPEDVEAAVAGQESLTTVADPASGESVRVFSQVLDSEGVVEGILQVSRSTTAVESALGRLKRTLLISIPVMVILVGLSGYQVAARALAPLDQITQTAQQITEDDLTTRLDFPNRGNDEVGRLAENFDNMLERLDTFVTREKEFIALVSHELRSPLMSMEAILDLASLRRDRGEADYGSALESMADETERMRTLTENLLHLARIDAGALKLNDDADLSRALTRAIRAVEPAARSKSLEIVADVPTGMRLTGDEAALERLFTNLLSNAAKYTDDGAIHVTAGMNADAWQVTVRDSGIGIADQALPLIFERFYRADDVSESPGTGLGLAIAKEIVDAHGGRIDVSSRLAQGSAFVITLPTTRRDVAVKANWAQTAQPVPRRA